MGWITSLVFIESGIDYKIAKELGQFITERIEKDQQALKISTQPTDNIKKLKFRGLCTGLFNSSNKSAQDFLAKERDNHH